MYSALKEADGFMAQFTKRSGGIEGGELPEGNQPLQQLV